MGVARFHFQSISAIAQWCRIDEVANRRRWLFGLCPIFLLSLRSVHRERPGEGELQVGCFANSFAGQAFLPVSFSIFCINILEEKTTRKACPIRREDAICNSPSSQRRGGKGPQNIIKIGTADARHIHKHCLFKDLKSILSRYKTGKKRYIFGTKREKKGKKFRDTQE
jgi:hypothetical protein